MKIIDAHCDVLSKMLQYPGIEFTDGSQLDVTLPRLKEADMLMQSFAIYLPEKIHPSFDDVLQCVEIFYRKVLIHPGMRMIRSRTDLINASANGQIGAMLTLEGVEGLMGNFNYLRILYYLGVRSIGITWNYANWAADGVLEKRQGGFTEKGRKLVRECNDLGIIVDVSHLSEKGFWELAEMSDKPFIASHSNALEICPHPRNLNNNQIKAIIQAGGNIGITFVPWFISSNGMVGMSQILSHIDHICSLGGATHIGFGSDFDGTERWVNGLEHPGKYIDLGNMLSKHYTDAEVKGFLWGNWYDFYLKNLPDGY
jgi:membrane dipeptidase